MEKNTLRMVTAASLFDGHDAAINIMRRILQSKGVEIIHLGHNRGVQEIVECAIEEDAHAIAITSYQGGHMEFFRYMKDLLDEAGCGHIKIFGGGGGTILPQEIEALHAYGIAKIYSPDDGRKLGLEGMIEDLVRIACSEVSVAAFNNAPENWKGAPPLGEKKEIRSIARTITLAEAEISENRQAPVSHADAKVPVVGITGTGGAGKSSVTDELVRRFLNGYPEKTIAVISVDPSRKKTGGALLGDRIRMNAIAHPRAYMRSMATRDDHVALSRSIQKALDVCKAAAFDLIILESAGVGQSDASIVDYVDVSMYVMTPEYGAASQLEKINMLDYADLVCINKFDKAGAADALMEVRKQYKRNHQLWTANDEDLPVTGTIAAKFNDPGVNTLFLQMIRMLNKKCKAAFDETVSFRDTAPMERSIIPGKRIRYLSDISESVRNYNRYVKEQADIATKLYQLNGVIKMYE
ncbi:cobalamin-dependent protein [Niabella drilacis]|uniref:Methylmalonyl-CoA mutase n=1 Tax=Niabella drilacis (strain DSM 25811 / CCM 8410 / CCUG 62505 / LMG 26954 / E90) TaxID=1285928 RepID=A0A1G6NU35_NIADE|nr:cobalamin-dependent protein [Niabella drilacis]SDC70756.1 methylmalonyl-CoA mutase [Niabella drilacis]